MTFSQLRCNSDYIRGKIQKYLVVVQAGNKFKKELPSIPLTKAIPNSGTASTVCS